MSKQVTVLGLEGDTLRGVRLDAAKKDDFARGLVRAWPLVASAPKEDADDSLLEKSALDEPMDVPDASATEIVAEADKPLARAFRAAAAAFGTREVVLSIPLSRVLVTTIRVPVEARDELASAAQLELDALSPFPDEALTVGFEVVFETDTELIALAAALPESAAEDISAARAAAKIDVVRTDVTALGWLRGLWPQICEKEGARCRLVLLNLDGGWDVLVLVDGAPVFIRGLVAVADAAALGREVMLSLIGLGDACPAVDDVVVCARDALPGDVRTRLTAFGPLREVYVTDDFAGVEGIARRVIEDAAIDVTPATWVEARLEHRFHRRLIAAVAVAGGIWFALIATLFGVDTVYGQMRQHQLDLQRDKVHKRAFDEVSALTNRVALIERYADHAHGALEVLKTVSDRMPGEVMTLGSYSYKRDEGVKLSGTTQDRNEVNDFTRALEAATFEDDPDVPIFARVKQTGGTKEDKRGVRFAQDCLFVAPEDEEGSGR